MRQYHQEPPDVSQRQVLYHSETLGNLQVQAWPGGLQGGVHKWISKDFWVKVQATPQDPSPIYCHDNTSGHCINVSNFSKGGREAYNNTRTVKEAMSIRFNDPSLNRNIGKFQLTHIWDEVLQDTPALHLKENTFKATPYNGPHSPSVIRRQVPLSLLYTNTLASVVLHQRVPTPFWHYVSSFAHPFVPSVVSIILISITASLRPDEAMLVWHVISFSAVFNNLC